MAPGVAEVDSLPGRAERRVRRVAVGIQKLKEVGIDHLELDFRLQFDKYEEALELFPTKVLSHVRG